MSESHDVGMGEQYNVKQRLTSCFLGILPSDSLAMLMEIEFPTSFTETKSLYPCCILYSDNPQKSACPFHRPGYQFPWPCSPEVMTSILIYTPFCNHTTIFIFFPLVQRLGSIKLLLYKLLLTLQVPQRQFCPTGSLNCLPAHNIPHLDKSCLMVKFWDPLIV